MTFAPHLHQYHRCCQHRPGGFPFFPGNLVANLNRLEQTINQLSSILSNMSGQVGGASGNHWMGGSGICCGNNDDQVIAGKGRIWGDPHFIGADGGKYDVQGKAGKTYNLLSDSGFQMNGRFDAWGSGGATVVGEVGINANFDKISVKGNGTVTVNGQEVADGQTVWLTDGGFVRRSGNDIKVESGEWTVDFQAKGTYLNMDVSTDNANADGVKPHGLLGQTFDGDGEARHGDKGRGAQGGGAIENMATITSRGDKSAIDGYEVSSLHSTDFGIHNRFHDYGGDITSYEFGSFSDSDFNDFSLNAMTNGYNALYMSLASFSFGMGFGFGAMTWANTDRP